MRLIDADELKEWIEAWFDMNKYYHPYSKRATMPTAELFDILDRIPTVDSVKHGRWIEREKDDNRCSLCGWGVWVNTNNYCPRCGAKMDGENDEID